MYGSDSSLRKEEYGVDGFVLGTLSLVVFGGSILAGFFVVGPLLS